MEQRVRIRLQTNSFIKGIHHQWVIVTIADLKSYDPSVIKIQNGTQVYFVNFDTNVILKFCNISKPFLVWRISMKLPVKIVLGDMRRSVAVSRAIFRLPLDSGLDMFFPTDSQNSFLIDVDVVIPVQFVSYPTISHIRMFFVNSPDLLCDFLITPFTVY